MDVFRFCAFKLLSLSLCLKHSWSSLSWPCCCAWLEFCLSQWTGIIAECKNLSTHHSVKTGNLLIYDVNVLCWCYWVIWNLLSNTPCYHSHKYYCTCLPTYVTCDFCCCRHERKLKAIVAGSTGDRFRWGVVPPVKFRMWLCHLQMYNMLLYCSKAVFITWSSVFHHPGNQGLMDILDMPNTNKYSFEGWDNSCIFTPLQHTLLKTEVPPHITFVLFFFWGLFFYMILIMCWMIDEIDIN